MKKARESQVVRVLLIIVLILTCVFGALLIVRPLIEKQKKVSSDSILVEANNGGSFIFLQKNVEKPIVMIF